MNRTAMTQLSLNLTYLMFRFSSANVLFVHQFFWTCLVLIGNVTGYSVKLTRFFSGLGLHAQACTDTYTYCWINFRSVWCLVIIKKVNTFIYSFHLNWYDSDILLGFLYSWQYKPGWKGQWSTTLVLTRVFKFFHYIWVVFSFTS